MEFNISTIDAASRKMFDGTTEEQQEANSFLVEWQNSPDAVVLAFEILSDPNTSKYAKNSSYSIIRNFVLRRFYINLDPDARAQFRENALICLASNLQNPIIMNELISTIVLISLYEWPENFPSFPFEIYPEQDDDEDSKTIFFIELFNELIEQVLNSDLIEPSRRIFLISEISSIIPDILTIVIPALSFETEKGIFKKAMNLLINLLSISPIESFQNDEILDSIISAFQYDESNVTYHSEWILFADKLLLKHPGRKSLLEVYSKPILTAACQLETHSVYLSHFIVRYLTKYSDDLVLLGIRENNESDSDELIQLLAKQYLMTLRSPLLENSDIYDIWYLWLQLFRSDKIDIPSEDPNAEHEEIDSPLFAMISFDDIVDPILEMLELSSIDGFIPQKVVFKCMSQFHRNFGDKIDEILVNSDLVPQTCIAMGILWGAMKENTEIEIASNLYSKVLSEKSNESVQPAVIFAMSFCVRFLSQNAEAQNSLSEVLCESLKIPNFIEPISHALSFLATSMPDIFINNDEILLNTLLQNMEDILACEKHGLRIFKAVSIISMKFTDEVFSGLSEPILEYLNSEDSLLIGLNCLTVQPQESPIFEFVIQKLLSLCPTIFNDDVPLDIVNTLFMALSKAFISLSFDSIKDIFLEMLDDLFQKPNLACQTFSLIEILRKKYEEVEELFPELLMDNLLLPYLESKMESESEVKSISDPDSQIPNENFVDLDRELFSMLSEFSPDMFNTPQINEAFLFGIRDMRRDVVKSASEALTELIKKIKPTDEIISFMQTFRRDFLHSIFMALFDMLHSTSFSAHCKLLSFFFEKSVNIAFQLSPGAPDNCEDMILFEQEFCEEISAILNLNLEDQSIVLLLKDLFIKLRHHYLVKKTFKEIIKEFLINSNRTTNAGIMKIEEQSEANKSKNLIAVKRVFVDEDDLKMNDFIRYNKRDEDDNEAII